MEKHIICMNWRGSIVKISIHPKVIYRFNTIRIKICPVLFFLEIDRRTLQFIKNAQDIKQPKQL